MKSKFSVLIIVLILTLILISVAYMLYSTVLIKTTTTRNTSTPIENKVTTYNNSATNYNYSIVKGQISLSLSGYLSSPVYDNLTGLVYAIYGYHFILGFNPENYTISDYMYFNSTIIDLAVNPVTGRIYALSNSSSAVYEINPLNYKVVGIYHVEGSLYNIVYDEKDGLLYISTKLDNGSYAVQLVGSKGVEQVILFPKLPSDLLYDPLTGFVIALAGSHLYAINGSEIIINTTDQYLETTNSSIRIDTLVVDPDNGVLYGFSLLLLVEFSPYNLSVVKTLPLNIPYMGPPSSLVLSTYAKGGIVYLVLNNQITVGSTCVFIATVNVTENKVFIYSITARSANGSTNVISFPTVISSYFRVQLGEEEPNVPDGAVFAKGRLVLTLPHSPDIFVVDPKTGNYTHLHIEADKPLIVYDPVLRHLYIAYFYNAILSLSPNNTQIGVLIVPQDVKALTYNPSNGYLYVANNKVLTEIDPYNDQIVWENHLLGGHIHDLVYDTANNILYGVYNTLNGSKIVAINSENGSIIGEIDLNFTTPSVCFSPNTGLLYVANTYNKSITVINGTRVVGSIEVGLNPTTIAVSNNLLYVGGVTVTKSGQFSNPRILVYNITDYKVIACIPLNYTPLVIRYYNGIIYVIGLEFNTEWARYFLFPIPSYVANLVILKAVNNEILDEVNVSLGTIGPSFIVSPNNTVYLLQGNIDSNTINVVIIKVIKTPLF